MPTSQLRILAQKQNRTGFRTSKPTAQQVAKVAPGPQPHPIQLLQRAIGNQAVLRLLRETADYSRIKNRKSPGPSSGPNFNERPAHAALRAIIRPEVTANTPEEIHEQVAGRVVAAMRAPQPQMQRVCAYGGRCADRQKEFAPGGGLADAAGRANEGLKIVTVSEIEAKVARILKAPGIEAADGRKAFNTSPAVAKANLYHTHFRNDDARLSYAVGVFQEFVGIDGNGVDQDALFATLVKYEMQMQGQAADIVIHTPPTKAESKRLGELRAERDRREYESYLAEVARIKEEEDKRLLSHARVYSGAATVGLYEYYVGDPVKAVASHFTQVNTAQMVSLMTNFIPIVGQLKGVAEGIIGRDLITGEELPNWERGLSILLSVIPEAHRIFSSGEAGMRELARVAADSGKPVEDVYRAAKVASRLTVEEVQAAEKITAGASHTPAQLELAAKLEELPGVAARPAARVRTAALAAKLEQVKQPVRLAGESHALSLRRVGNELRVWLCSNGCGELIAKAEAMIARLPKDRAARGELEKFIGQVRKEETWINEVETSEEAQKELRKLQQSLEDIEGRYPGAVNPDVPVAHGSPGEPPAEAPAAVAATVPEVLPPVGHPTQSFRVGKQNLSLRGLQPDLAFAQQFSPGEMAALKRSPNLRVIGEADLPWLTPRDLARMVAEGKMTKQVFDGIMKAGEDRIAARGGG